MNTTEMLKLLELDFDSFKDKIDESPKLHLQKDTNERTLLHWTSLNGRKEFVDYLVTLKGVEIDSGDDTNATPLILAVLKGNVDIVKVLLDHGANINHQNNQGHSPLQYACSKGWSDVVGLLLERGSDVDIRDRRGDTSLHRLASLGRLELLKLLLNRSPKPLLDVQNAEGNTAMHIACEDNEVSCALLLLDHGASVDIENRDKKSPFDLAKSGLRQTINEKKTGNKA